MSAAARFSLRRLPILTCLVAVFLVNRAVMAQALYDVGEVELTNHTVRFGQLALRQGKQGSELSLREGGQQRSFSPAEVLRFTIGTESFVTRNLSATSAPNLVFLRQLVTGPAGLLQYRRTDQSEVYLIERNDSLTALNPADPVRAIRTLFADCTPFQAALTRESGRFSKRTLIALVADYNRCQGNGPVPSLPDAANRSIWISVGPRLWVTTGAFRLSSGGETTEPSTRFVSVSPGLTALMHWRNRVGLGLDLALQHREGRWNLDPTSKRVVLIDKLSERSLLINPFLHYALLNHRNQPFYGRLMAGLVFNKLLSGFVDESTRAFTNPVRRSINQEAGLDEVGFSAGAGCTWQPATRLQLTVDLRYMVLRPLSGFELQNYAGNYASLKPHLQPLSAAVGIQYQL
ncbi:hypothetical protein [Spirosoma luteolum]